MIPVQESTFRSFDSVELFYRTWSPTNALLTKALIVLHAEHEHSGRLSEIVEKLNLTDYWAFGFDSRGQGRSAKRQAKTAEFSDLVKDLESFVRFISEKHNIPVENMVVISNSVSAVVASTWVHDFAPRIRSMVLVAPAFRVKLYLPFAMTGLRLLNRVRNSAFLSSYLSSNLLTHDPVRVKRYDQDPLVNRKIAVKILVGLHDASTRLLKDAASIATPTLILAAGQDYFVSLAAQKAFFRKLGSPQKTMRVFPRFFHSVLSEKGREEGIKMVREFVLESMNRPLDRRNLLNAHREGPSRKAYEQLLKPLGFFESLYWNIQRLSVASIGRLSQGISLGLKQGFDSGLSLDYVYENQPRGLTFLGQLIDQAYLNSRTWRAIRERKINLKKQIETVIQKLHSQGEAIRILDVAGGPGRYLLELAKRHSDKNIQILIRDNAEANLEYGRQISRQMNLANVRYERANAFASGAVGVTDVTEFKPNVIVIAGLFELFQDNDMIRRCVDQVARESDSGATLIYSGQPYHPQTESIARTLPNREGREWIMRLRSQAELDEIFRTYGFQKKDMMIDSFGIHTVSIAEKALALPLAKARGSSNELRRSERPLELR